MTDNKNLGKSSQISHSYRYIDDLISFVSKDIFTPISNEIYPASLPLKLTSTSDTSTEYLDLTITVDPFSHCLYNKTDSFPFDVIRYVHADSNVHTSVGFRVCGSQLIRFIRICAHKQDFVKNCANLFEIFIQHGFKKNKLFEIASRTIVKHRNSCWKYGIFTDAEIKLLVASFF